MGYPGRSSVLCKTYDESRDRLFFDYTYTVYLWEWCRLKLKLDSNSLLKMEQEAIELLQNSKTKDQVKDIAFISFCTTIYHIWQENN